MRVLFVHGLESSPRGTKARYLSEAFDAITPEMDTSDFLACLARQRRAIVEHQPDVVIGSSFGGAVVVALLNEGAWRGPTLLLAQAALKFDSEATLPEGVPVLLVHGTQDEVIDPEDSRALAKTGSKGLVRLIEVEDDHRLLSLVETGRLEHLVREAAAG